jgi:DNA-directed RNA polymerase specialized sigma24 family protein
MGYAAVALFREATRGRFKRLYRIRDYADPEMVQVSQDLEKSIQRETLQLVIDRLSWFDRMVMNLYLEGWSMVEVADGSDIAVGVLYQSLHRSRKVIINAICNERDES